MAWKPVFSPDSRRVAARVRLNGRYNIILDGAAYKQDFDLVWDPVFSPDGDKIMIRAIMDGNYCRIIAPTTDFMAKKG